MQLSPFILTIKNLTCHTQANQRVIRQLNYLEHFGPTYVHIPGKHNFLADMFSCLPCRTDLSQPQEEEKTELKELKLHPMTFDSWYSSTMYDHLDNPEVMECFLNLPDNGNDQPIALDYGHLAQDQLLDPNLLRR